MTLLFSAFFVGAAILVQNQASASLTNCTVDTALASADGAIFVQSATKFQMFAAFCGRLSARFDVSAGTTAPFGTWLAITVAV